MIPQALCDQPDACCVSLYDIAAHLLAETYDAVLNCYPTVEDCPPLAAYVTMGTGDDGITDAVTVAMMTIAGSPNTRAGGLGLWRSTFIVMLRESGWPTVRVNGDEILMPAPDLQVRAAQHVFSMGEAIHRRLAALQTSRGLTPAGVPCAMASIGVMSPLNPQGGVVGWQIPVTVDLPWN